MSQNPLRIDGRRLAAGIGVLALCATATVGLASRADAAKKPPAAFTWTGADAATNSNWSDPLNWAGDVAPVAGSPVSMAFPALSCVADGTCNTPNDDIDGMVLSSLTVTEPGGDPDGDGNGPSGYVFLGDALTLQGPLVSGGDTSTGSSLANMLTLQQFDLTGSSAAWTLSQTQTVFSYGVTGPTALKVTFASGGSLSLNGDTELGNVSLVGAVHNTQSNGGFAVFGSLNATDGKKTSATDVSQFMDNGSFGPLTTKDVNIQLGNGGSNHDHGSTQIAGSLDFNKQGVLTVIAFEGGTDGADPQAGSDYPVVQATGAVKLAGALNPLVDCDAPIGFTYTFIRGAKLSGSFTDTSGNPITSGEIIPSGENACDSGGPSPDLQITIDKKAGTVSATTVSTGGTDVARAAHTSVEHPTAVRLHVGRRTVEAFTR